MSRRIAVLAVTLALPCISPLAACGQPYAEGDLPALQEITVATASDLELLRTLSMPRRFRVQEMAMAAFSPDGEFLAAAGMCNEVAVWDVSSGELVHRLSFGYSVGVAVAYHPSGERIAGGDVNGRVVFWDLETGDTTHSFYPGSGGIHWLEFSSDGTKLITVNIYDGVRIWDVTGDPVLISSFFGHGERVNTASFDSTGDLVVSGGGDNRGRIWDASTGEEILRLPRAGHFIEGIDFTPDDARVVAASDDARLFVWDAEDGSIVHWLRGHVGPVNGMAMSPGGNVVASFGNDQTVRLWDIEDGVQLFLGQEHTDLALRGTFNPTGTLIASVCRDGYVRLWGVPASVP